MSSTFQILHYRDRGCLYLKLSGDMDGASACEIINLLEDNRKGISEVVIDTSGLVAVTAFGREVFSNNFHKIKNHYTDIFFTGERSKQIAPADKRSL